MLKSDLMKDTEKMGLVKALAKKSEENKRLRRHVVKMQELMQQMQKLMDQTQAELEAAQVVMKWRSGGNAPLVVDKQGEEEEKVVVVVARGIEAGREERKLLPSWHQPLQHFKPFIHRVPMQAN